MNAPTDEVQPSATASESPATDNLRSPGKHLVLAWRSSAQRLGNRVSLPFTNSAAHTTSAYVRDAEWQRADPQHTPGPGYFVSQLGPSSQAPGVNGPEISRRHTAADMVTLTHQAALQ